MKDIQLNVVLYEPEIANNVGSIMRTCFLTNCWLHIIEPTGFIFDHRNFARSSANNHDQCKYSLYDDWDDFLKKQMLGDSIMLFATRYGQKPLSSFKIKETNKKNIYLVFGKESTGIPKDILKMNLNNCYRFPMIKIGRSLNLSNSVAISVYETLRQFDYLDLEKKETIKGSDYLLKE